MADSAPRESASRRVEKSAAAFRTISEVSGELDVPAHVLRFWESKFSQIRPLKRGGGRRYYRPEDIVLLRRIRELLYTDGYTIKGVQKLLRSGGGRPVAENPAPAVDIVGAAGADVRPARTEGPDAATRRELNNILGDLEEMRDLLREAVQAAE